MSRCEDAFKSSLALLVGPCGDVLMTSLGRNFAKWVYRLLNAIAEVTAKLHSRIMNVEWPFNGVPSSIEDMQEIRQMNTIELSIIYEQAIRMTTKLSFWSTLIHLAEH